ncbi:MAG: DUF2071 domain-containing protein, partial [Verrucomicrobiae bacterium]|nr:DUF2071 domain-containing protein [Verrucomicrobiae bacterium]
RVPDKLAIDTYDGQAWIGVIPFQITNLSARGLPTLPGLRTFPEINVRTYVRHKGRPGVYFFSLDVPNAPAVITARLTYHLDYYLAKSSIRRDDDWVHFKSERKPGDESFPIRFEGRYRPNGKPFQAEPGSLEHFLTERYCLFAEDFRGDIHRGDIHHLPWPLQRARADIPVNTMTTPLELSLIGRDPVFLFADRLEALFWVAQRC